MNNAPTVPDRTIQYDALKGRGPAVGLLLKAGDRPSEADGVGTLFLVRFETQLFLVTALHCLRWFNPGDPCLARFADTVIVLNGLSFLPSLEADIVVALIDFDDRARAGIAHGLGRQDPDGYIRSLKDIAAQAIAIDNNMAGTTAEFGLLGYPVSRNKLHVHERGRSANPTMFAITLELRGKSPAKSEGLDRFSFAYNHEAWGTPDPHGLSGGPVFGLIPTAGGAAFRTVLIGVAVEHDRKTRLLAAVPIREVVHLLCSMIVKVNEAFRAMQGLTRPD